MVDNMKFVHFIPLRCNTITSDICNTNFKLEDTTCLFLNYTSPAPAPCLIELINKLETVKLISIPD